MAFYRKGTVSKASGPSHINSYALRNVPIKYKPPIFVPEILYLPVDWIPPEMFSQDRFRYDYSTERKVIAQARSRALSVAAEASLQRKQIEELQRKQREKEEAEAKAKELAKPRPPITFSNDILTPIPVSSTSNTSTSTIAETASAPLLDVQVGTEQNSTTDTNTQGGIELSAEPPVIKSLGQMSIREFEGDNNDPFEIASLQAINDMEVLQSVLQPIAPPILTSDVSSSNKMVATSPPLTQTSMMSSGNQLSDIGGTATTVTQSSPIPAPRSTSKQTSPPTIHNTLFPSSTPPSAIPPIQTVHPSPVIVPPQAIPNSAAVVGVGALSFADSFVTNNQTATVSGSAIPVVGSPGNVGVMKGAPSSSEPGVGLLIDIGGHVPAKSDLPQPLPAVDRPQGSLSSTFNSAPVDQPVPKPRTHIPTSPSGQSTPSGTSVYPQQSSSSPVVPSRPSPTVPPKGVRPDVGGGASPVVPPKGIKPERSSSPQVGFVVPSNSPTPSQGLNRLGLGVQVLPPIPQSSSHIPMSATQPQTSMATQNVPPSYTVNPSPPTHPRISPPPPYSSPAQRPKTHTQSPRVVPRTYKLPDPQASLTSDQRSEVESLSGMGFPAPRVARAVLRYEGDRTKVLDFLFLVGKVEEEKYTGDSAETALIASKEDANKAVEYLKRVEGFKNIGFQEKKIHEAYEKSGDDWDKALDCLTEDR